MTAIPFNQYTATQLRLLSDGVNVSPILPFESPAKEISKLNGNRGRISLSGAQSKYSVVIRDGLFHLTNEGEQGTHILKPAITDFEHGWSPFSGHDTQHN